MAGVELWWQVVNGEKKKGWHWNLEAQEKHVRHEVKIKKRRLIGEALAESHCTSKEYLSRRLMHML